MKLTGKQLTVIRIWTYKMNDKLKPTRFQLIWCQYILPAIGKMLSHKPPYWEKKLTNWCWFNVWNIPDLAISKYHWFIGDISISLIPLDAFFFSIIKHSIQGYCKRIISSDTRIYLFTFIPNLLMAFFSFSGYDTDER